MANNENKMRETDASVSEFLQSVSEKRQAEAAVLIDIMERISGYPAKMWGDSIIGFGTQHYKYESGREGDMPLMAFSPRKARITVYFGEGFQHYGEYLDRLGKYKTSVSCLYINKLPDVDLAVLEDMLKASFKKQDVPEEKPSSVEAYIANVPEAARPNFDALRAYVKELLPDADEVLSYGIIGYKTDKKRAKMFISGFKDHVGIYPVPKDDTLAADLKPYVRGKGTIWFPLDAPLPMDLVRRIVEGLTK